VAETPGVGISYSSTGAQVIVYHPVAMRSKTRSVTLSNVTHFSMGIPNTVSVTLSGLSYSAGGSTDFSSFLDLAHAANGSAGVAGTPKPCLLQANGTGARLYIESEFT
jgi:YbbR domain-containing protein